MGLFLECVCECVTHYDIYFYSLFSNSSVVVVALCNQKIIKMYVLKLNFVGLHN